MVWEFLLRLLMDVLASLVSKRVKDLDLHRLYSRMLHKYRLTLKLDLDRRQNNRYDGESYRLQAKIRNIGDRDARDAEVWITFDMDEIKPVRCDECLLKKQGKCLTRNEQSYIRSAEDSSKIKRKIATYDIIKPDDEVKVDILDVLRISDTTGVVVIFSDDGSGSLRPELYVMPITGQRRAEPIEPGDPLSPTITSPITPLICLPIGDKNDIRFKLVIRVNGNDHRTVKCKVSLRDGMIVAKYGLLGILVKR